MKYVFAAVVAAGALTGPRVAAADEPTKQQCVAADEAAQPLRRSGKLRDSRRQLQVCISQACPGPVREDCAQRLDELDKAIPTVVFVVRTADDHDLTAVRVSMDGVPLVDHLDGTEIAVDPGQHTFAFEAEGFARAEQTMLLHEGDKLQRPHIILQPAARAEPVAPPTPTPASPESSSWNPVPTYVALGVGGAGLIVTTVFGILAMGDKSSLDGACGTHKTTCPSSSQSDISGMHTNSIISDVGLGVAIVGVGVGGVLWYLGHSGSGASSEKASGVHVEPWVSTRGAGLVGTF